MGLKLKIVNLSIGDEYRMLGKALRKELVRNGMSGAKNSLDFRGSHFGPRNLPPSWQKIYFIEYQLKTSDCDWVIWIDSDVICLNSDRNIRSLLANATKDVLFSGDVFGYCGGVFAARNVEWSRAFFRTIQFVGFLDKRWYRSFDNRDTWEQNSVKALCSLFPEIRGRVGIIPESVVQNRMSIFCEDAWLFHFWMQGRTVLEVMDKRRKVAAKGWCLETFREIGCFEYLELVHAVAVGECLGLSVQDLSKLLKRPVRQLLSPQRYRLKGKEGRVLLSLIDLCAVLKRVFSQRREIQNWFLRRNASLGNRSPASTLLCPDGLDRVLLEGHRLIDRFPF